MTTVTVGAPVTQTVSVAAPQVTATVALNQAAVSVQDDQVSVSVGQVATQVARVSEPSSSTISSPQVSVVTAGVPGPEGLSAEDLSMKYRKLVDIEDDTPLAGQTTIYKGWSSPGAGASSAAVWKVQRLVLNDEDDIIDSGFAGTALFDQVWDNRAALSYQ